MPAKRKSRQLAANLRQERPDYAYLKEVFRQLRAELGITVPAMVALGPPMVAQYLFLEPTAWYRAHHVAVPAGRSLTPRGANAATLHTGHQVCHDAFGRS